MLTATILALAAAVIHAAWNLSVKQGGDRFIALWGQFTIAGAGGLIVVLAFGDFPARGWIWAGISGCIHVPYCVFLARAYDHGDFSLVYPMARGTGALLAAFGGLLLLGDHISPVGIGAIVIVAAGLFVLAGRARGPALWSALAVAAAIGAYSVSDAKGIRSTDTPLYAFASFVGVGVTSTTYGLLTHRGPAMRAGMQANWRRFAVMGLATTVTYGMVQLAFERAAVGYVTALRESSVVLAAFIGSRMLGEPAGRRRIIASFVVLGGLILLVIAR
ncbi:MAG: putative inner rane protein [Ilumatobacteraceae bacterium]|nr:putative inner rane protein [Ilumatobacteraceae bacterium]